MWRVMYALSTVWWHVHAAYLKVAVRVWLNRAVLRNGDRLVADLEAIEWHIQHRGGSTQLEPPYDYLFRDPAEQEQDDE